MAFNIKKAASEAYNKGVIKAGELRDERQRKLGYKVSVVVEREDGKRLLINTHGVKGHVQIDDYDEERISKFLGHNLGAMRSALKSGKKWVDNQERVTFDFSAPERTPAKASPNKPKTTKTPKWRFTNLTKKAPVKRLPAPKSPNIRLSAAAEIKPNKGYYSWTLGRWVK
jgi:phospholipase C